MSLQETAHHLMGEIGPLLDAERVTEFAEESAWSVGFSEGTAVHVELDDSAGRLVLTSDVAAGGRPAGVYELLLRYNYLWTGHGGLRTALAGPDGPVVLMFELPVAGLEASRLCDVLANFRRAVEGWREILDGRARGDGASEPGPVGSGFIRV